MSPLIVTVKVRPRYLLAGNVQDPLGVYDRLAHCTRPIRPHQRAYKLIDWAHALEYMNDRVLRYPIPSALLTLRSEHNEDRRQAKHRKGRAARK